MRRTTLRVIFVATLLGSVLAATLGALPQGWAATSGDEPAITTAGPVGDYQRRMHDKIHARWAEGFLKTGAAPAKPGTPAGKPVAIIAPAAIQALSATATVTIRWDGTVADAGIVKSSGMTEFDRTVIEFLRKSAPYPLPTSDVLSDDGYAHFEWTLAGDRRACGTGAKLVRVEDPIDVSLPRLMRSNRIGEAVRRVGEASAVSGKEAGEDALDKFARVYLGRTLPDPVLDAAASVALAQTGDKVQEQRLRSALSSRATLKLAAQGLQTLGIDVCGVVAERLAGTAFARDMGLEAIRTIAAMGSNLATCRPALESLLNDGAQPAAARLAAFELLAGHLGDGVRPLAMTLVSDKDAAVRGAAILASVRKGGGRPEMYRLAPLLHDKAVEVRGGASAGMVRAAGDVALEQLYLLGRETDPRPAKWVAAELAHLSSAASAEFLGHMFKKDNREVQLAAAKALAARKDAGARAQLDAVKSNLEVSSEARAVAMAALSPPSAAAVAAGQTTVGGFQAMLKAGRTDDAVAWVVEKFPALEPKDAVDVLGAWLVRPTGSTPVAAPAAPASSPDGAPSAPSASALPRR